MLKGNLYKIMLIGMGLFLTAATNSYYADNSNTVPEKKQGLKVKVIHHYLKDSSGFLVDHTFDANGFCSCLHDLDANEYENAPRVVLNLQAAKYVKDYLKKNDEGLEKIRDRSEKYFQTMDSVFTMYDLPVELKYLAVVESELKPMAKSHVGAVGLWQLMPSTARLLGLKITSRYDERRLTYKSTVAAAKYLRDLHDQFGDWLLAIAAYNGGPGYVYSAIKKSGSRNFWKLQYFLPLETRNHVKRYISTHYYFEGQGSLTTMTKAETISHIKAVTKFLAERERKAEENRNMILSLLNKNTMHFDELVLNADRNVSLK